MPESRFPSMNPRARMTMVIIAIVLVLAVAAGGTFLYLRDDQPQGHTDLITLAATANSGSPQSTEGELVTHLAFTNGHPDDVGLKVSLTDMKGRTLPADAEYGVSIELTNLNTGSTIEPQSMAPVGDVLTPTFELATPGLDEEGWWRIHTAITRPEGDSLASEYYVLLPDPNLAGFESPPASANDPAAETLLSTAITQMSEWTSLRWWEWLSGGNDSLIMADFAVTTTDANGQPPAFQNDMLFAGGFERKADGAPPAPPARNHYTAITIGEQAWSRNADGEIKPMSPTRYLPINRYPETYQGATSIQMGIQEDLNGRSAQIVTFHVPALPTQSEAWYAFWIDTETGDILKLAMVANNHYMIWIYTDINEPFVIQPPAGAENSLATPSATPAS